MTDRSTAMVSKKTKGRRSTLMIDMKIDRSEIWFHADVDNEWGQSHT